MVEIFKMWSSISFDAQTIIYLNYWCVSKYESFISSCIKKNSYKITSSYQKSKLNEKQSQLYLKKLLLMLARKFTN